MDLAQKLVSYTHSAFDQAPGAFIAFRARHVSDAYRHRIRNRTITGYLGDEPVFSAQLAEHTLQSLILFISKQPGMSVVYAAPPEELGSSAMILLDGNRRQIESNGDCVYAYSSLLWCVMEAFAIELESAKSAIGHMLQQMSIRTAEDDFLDEWANYFGFPRNQGEDDQSLRARILLEAPRPRSNNMAIALAIEQQFGNAANVIDVTTWGDAFPLHGANELLSIDHDGEYFYNGAAQQILGFFDVEVELQLEQAAFEQYMRLLGEATSALTQSASDMDDERLQQVELAALVEEMRAAGALVALEEGVDEAAYRSLIELMRASGTQLRELRTLS